MKGTPTPVRQANLSNPPTRGKNRFMRWLVGLIMGGVSQDSADFKTAQQQVQHVRKSKHNCYCRGAFGRTTAKAHRRVYVQAELRQQAIKAAQLSKAA